jgi:hypothetical protein
VAVGVGLAGLLAYGLLRSRPGTKPSPGTAKPNARPRNRLGLPSDIPATVPVSRDR